MNSIKRSSSTCATFLAVLACFSISSAALAHTAMLSSQPLNNAVLEAAPEHLSLSFGDSVTLARVELRGPNSLKTDLPLGTQVVSSEFALPLPQAMQAGRYTARWTILTADGHTMSGAVSFNLEL